MFYASHYVPVALCQADSLTQVYSSKPEFDVFSSILREADGHERSPHILTLADQGTYGVIRVKGSSAVVLVGPTFSLPVEQNVVLTVARQNLIGSEKLDDLRGYLSSIPVYSYNQFANLVGFLNFIINDEPYDIAGQFSADSEPINNRLAVAQAEHDGDPLDGRVPHDTYGFESLMVALIRDGEVEKLAEFLQKTAQSTELHEGKLADSPLRQAKNLFVGIATMVGKVAAISGGLNVEEAYQLIDLYIQECEKTFSLDLIKLLQYNMILDFASRVAQSKLPENVSRDIFLGAQFIQNNTNRSIGIDDVAHHIGRSRAYLTRKFRSEMGRSVNDYIIDCKIRDAKRFLSYTDKAISEISGRLCFSSQAYFQSVFKKRVGTTPNE